MNIGSLFSGMGGIEIGFEKSGFETEWFVEREPYAKEILKKRFPRTKIYEDVTKIDFRKVPRVEILTGGFPCQDISNAGKRAGIKGSRSSLWNYYLKAIRQIQPKIAFIENVSALLNRGLNVVLADLAEIGYDAEWYCVPASAVGANHQRDRIFIIAYPNSNGDRFNSSTDRREEEEIWDKDNESIISDECGKANGSREISNTNSKRLQRREKARNFEESWKDREQQLTRQSGYWATEPNVGRVAHGIPFRVDRIKCLGNAVVPQVAEVFAEAIKKGDVSHNKDK